MTAKGLNFIFLTMIVVLLVLLQNGCNNTNSLKGMYETISDSLKTAKNELGQQTATIGALQGDKVANLMEISTKDSTILWLKDVAKQYKGKIGTAIVLSNTTSSSETIRTVHTKSIDTLIKDSLYYIYPEYSVDWVNEWEQGKIRASKDSIYRQITFTNEFEITIGEQRNKWFKPREYDVSVKNLNPNTSTKELRAFTVRAKPKRFTLGLHLGYGMDLVNFRPVPYVGVGVGFTILEIK